MSKTNSRLSDYASYMGRHIQLIKLTQEVAENNISSRILGVAKLRKMAAMYDADFMSSTGGPANGAGVEAFAEFLTPRVLLAVHGDEDKLVSIIASIAKIYQLEGKMSDELREKLFTAVGKMYEFFTQPDDTYPGFRRYEVLAFINKAGDMVSFMSADEAIERSESSADFISTEMGGRSAEGAKITAIMVKKLVKQYPIGAKVTIRPMPDTAACKGGNKAKISGVGTIVDTKGIGVDGRAVPTYMVEFDHSIGTTPDGEEINQVFAVGTMFEDVKLPVNA